MAGAVAFVVFVLAQDASTPAAQAFTAAAREVLGQTVRVDVREVEEDLSDTEALDQAGKADGIIELSWSADHNHVGFHCYVKRENRWIDRTITFGAGDSEWQRGRMLGFAVASMFAVPLESGDQAELSMPPEHDSQRPPPAIVPRDRPSPTLPSYDEASPSSAGAVHALDFAALATTGIGGRADMFGAAAAYRKIIATPWWVRFGIGGRVGEIPEAQANTRMLVAGLGLVWSLLGAEAYDVSLRVDVLASWFEVGHLSADDPVVVRRSRWLSGADSLLSGTYNLSPDAGVFAAGGLEGMFGKTEIYTHGVRVSTVPPLRIIAELGLRSRF